MKNSRLQLLIATLVAGCGGSGSAPPADATGIVSLALTDAAVDNVSEVWVEFDGVTLKPQNGDGIVFDFDPPKTFNLLELQDGQTAALLPDTMVPVGRYIWMRLAVNADFDNVMDSYVLRNDGTSVELRVPSGSQSGLKLQNGFTVTQNQSTNMVLDWDLRKALSEPSGQPGMHLRPALRVTDMAAYGTLQGTVAGALTMGNGCGADASVGNAVYVYDGEVDDPVDIDGTATDPLVTASVGDDLTYMITFLSAGEYTAAFTCQADLDDPESQDSIEFAVVHTMIAINDGETTTVDF